MKNCIAFFKKETILTIAWILAIVSAFFVHPSLTYISYIDFRSLGILWSLMIIMEGLKQNGFFDKIGRTMLARTRNNLQLALILVFLCFFSSMLITNDVALITFVPFALFILKACDRTNLIIPVVVLQTLAANLGSMLTPIGNPQNLYLYGLSGMSAAAFIRLLLPLTALSGILLLISVFCIKNKKDALTQTAIHSDNSYEPKRLHIVLYLLLFVFALPVVGRMIPYQILVIAVLVIVFFMAKKVLISIDYALLLTFVGFFIFTGNIGRLPAISGQLTSMVGGHEVGFGILLSQIISNVPAALLLSGFADSIPALIIGTDLGGLGTLIASMASLISFKLVAHNFNHLKGRYFLHFTWMNLVYLIILTGGYYGFSKFLS